MISLSMVKYLEIMNIGERILTKLKEDFSLQGLIKIVLLLLIVLLFQATAGIWQGLFSRLFNVFKPFLYGFVIAYILRRAFTRLEKAGVPRKISIPIVYVIIIALLVLLISTLFPIVLTRTSSLIESMINGINWVTVHIQTLTSGDMPPWIVGLVDAGVSALSDFRSLIPNLTGSLPEFVNATISTLTMIIFSIVISIFMSFGWEKIRYYIVYLSMRVGRRFNTAVFEIDHEIDDYLKSMLTLMLIRFGEYALLYFLIGHPDWLILGLLTAISIFIPYIGPVIISTVGILTALTLSMTQCLILIAAIVILSQVDEYVVAPMVHARNTHVSPLWTLFSIFAGGTFLGIPGIIIALPVFLSCRVIYRIYIKEELPKTEDTAGKEAKE